MESIKSILGIVVTWRGNKYIVQMESDSSLKELGDELLRLTGVKADTMRLIVPQFANKISKLLSPFSDEHSKLSLQEASITEGKSIRMMGVSVDEVSKLLENAKVDQRIAGFDEEERRMKQRISDRPTTLKLPQGPYIFCDFRTLQIPGVELYPPASEALKRMHMLAADPGIIAIMNKHRWRIGIMTEMAPVGYVGVSPKCILGYNKNHGEEISLRLRTDDLKGFRKYESIKKTLLHELAHMVYPEHDANFYSLDKQLNQEAASLDWTKSRGHNLSRVKHPEHDTETFYGAESISVSQKLGGSMLDQLASAREASVAAACRRLANAPVTDSMETELLGEPDPDDSSLILPGNYHLDMEKLSNKMEPSYDIDEPDPDDMEAKPDKLRDQAYINKASKELDSDECHAKFQYSDPNADNGLVALWDSSNMQIDDPDPDDVERQRCYESLPAVWDRLLTAIETLRTEIKITESTMNLETLLKKIKNEIAHPNSIKSKRFCEGKENLYRRMGSIKSNTEPDQDDEPDPDDLDIQIVENPISVVCDHLQKVIETLGAEIKPVKAIVDLQALLKIIRNVIKCPDVKKFEALGEEMGNLNNEVGLRNTIFEPHPIDLEIREDGVRDEAHINKASIEPGPDQCEEHVIVQSELDRDDTSVPSQKVSNMLIDEPDPDDQEIKRIQDPVTAVCGRLQKAMDTLRSELNSPEATMVMQTLLKIIRNVIEHPNELKFRRLRKANSLMQKNVTNHKAAMEILHLVGFSEDVICDEVGKVETYIVLKRNDTGLLWLAKSSLEACIA
ncbi:hypothetical protein K2173_018869 [Erythroxylum novogranatense]|uniref:WLM domain-containing protein n=1 Tax=Erythroxylum novogranatense TaxID=1862640 RepID=A0AAV8SB58_9ROSI|nr:hypothetical protein K2173_018869 [Erythroxylum novogranatense]